MTTQLATKQTYSIARPLKVLVPLIKSELEEGDQAGHEHYRLAGQLLIEAKDQIPHGGWHRWLAKNFELSKTTANLYMRWARGHKHLDTGSVQVPYTSLNEMKGQTERQRDQRKAEQKFRETLREVAREDFTQDKQRIADEIILHRKLADELIDLGYRALATRLHPDRGGSKEAMARLNRVRDELKHTTKNRRFL